MSLKHKHFGLILAVAAIFATVPAAQAQYRAGHRPGERPASVEQQMANAPINHKNDKISRLLAFSYQFQGTPYRHGASGPKAFDCSGFTSYVFREFGYKLSRSSGGQLGNGRRVSTSELKPGDLVFFGGRGGGSRIGHVGIVTEVNNDHSFKFIHAASRGVRVSSSTEAYYRSRYRAACRVIEETD